MMNLRNINIDKDINMDNDKSELMTSLILGNCQFQ